MVVAQHAYVANPYIPAVSPSPAMQLLERREKETVGDAHNSQLARLRYSARLYRLLAPVLLAATPVALAPAGPAAAAAGMPGRWGGAAMGGSSGASSAVVAERLRRLAQRMAMLAAGSCIAVHREFKTRRDSEAAAAAAVGGGLLAIAVEYDGGDALLSKGEVRARLKVGWAGLGWAGLAHQPISARGNLLLAWAIFLEGDALLLGWQTSLQFGACLPACACCAAGAAFWPPGQPVERAGGVGRPCSVCCRPGTAQARVDGCLLRPGAVLRLASVDMLCHLVAWPCANADHSNPLVSRYASSAPLAAGEMKASLFDEAVLETLADSLLPLTEEQLQQLPQHLAVAARAAAGGGLRQLREYALSTFVRRYLNRSHLRHVSNERAAVNSVRFLEVGGCLAFLLFCDACAVLAAWLWQLSGVLAFCHASVLCCSCCRSCWGRHCSAQSQWRRLWCPCCGRCWACCGPTSVGQSPPTRQGRRPTGGLLPECRCCW